MKKIQQIPMEGYITAMFLVFGLFWLFKAYELDANYSGILAGGVSSIGPHTFPMIISWLIIVSSLVNMYKMVRTIQAGENVRDDAIPVEERKDDFLRVLGMIVVAALYVVALKPIGFIPTTIVFMLVALILFGVKSKKVVLIISVLVPIVLWVLFKMIIKVQLP